MGEARFSNEADLVETFLDGVMILKRLWENGLRLSNMVNKYPISAFIESVLNQHPHVRESVVTPAEEPEKDAEE